MDRALTITERLDVLEYHVKIYDLVLTREQLVTLYGGLARKLDKESSKQTIYEIFEAFNNRRHALLDSLEIPKTLNACNHHDKSWLYRDGKKTRVNSLWKAYLGKLPELEHARKSRKSK